jgi:predicted O-linked N-acetylglucosamine transferase (SPINDLY family)
MGTRTQYGLPEEGFIFCCFNHNYKITPQIFQKWVDLLQAVEGSTLWLMDLNEVAKKNLLAYAANQIDPSRIVFAQRVPSIDEHLARYCLADLFLDTFPYNGHTTCSDALSSGLPLVTLQGESFASRVCSSLLADLDLQALSATSHEEYFQLALELAQDREKLASLKAKLREQLLAKQWTTKSQVYADDMAALISKVA